MPDPISLTRGEARVFLKWHRARRRADDPAFSRRRILEGLAAGASVEVDLVLHAEDGFAVLHDLTLDRATTGRGAVRQASADALRALHLRGNRGEVLPDRVMLLEDSAGLVGQAGLHPDALLQLDFKEDAAVLTAPAIANFARSLAAVAPRIILSCGDAEAVRLLSAGVPGRRIGYDPCHGGALERLRHSRDYDGFVADALRTSPDAEMIYLHHALIFAAAERGVDLAGGFRAAGRRIDAYTIQRADAAGLAATRRLIEFGVDQITTDDPEGLYAALS